MTEYRYELGGVAFGAGTPIRVGDIRGLGKPNVRSGDLPIPAAHGSFPVVDYYEERVVSIEMSVVGSSPANAMALMRALAQAWSPDSTAVGATYPLTIHLPGFGEYSIVGRPRRFEPILVDLESSFIPIVADYVGHDPLLYTPQETTQVSLGGTVTTDGSGQASYATGLAAPLVAPLVLSAAPAAPSGAVDRPGTVVVVGNTPTWPVYEVLGPVLGPRLAVGPNVISFPELNIPAGQTLVIDTHPARRSVQLQGASAYSKLAPGTRLKSLAPGTHNVSFTARTYDAAARATVRWRSGFTA